MFTRRSYICLAIRVSCTIFSVALLNQLSTCGTLFYPERRGQIDGRIDPAIAVFNAIDLLFYIIPDLTAFGIDSATGVIYLPDVKYPVTPEALRGVVGADGKVDDREPGAILEREIGRELSLDDPCLIRHSGSVEQLAVYGLKPAA